MLKDGTITTLPTSGISLVWTTVEGTCRGTIICNGYGVAIEAKTKDTIGLNCYRR